VIFQAHITESGLAKVHATIKGTFLSCHLSPLLVIPDFAIVQVCYQHASLDLRAYEPKLCYTQRL
jgi:hypothetical protein